METRTDRRMNCLGCVRQNLVKGAVEDARMCNNCKIGYDGKPSEYYSWDSYHGQ